MLTNGQGSPRLKKNGKGSHPTCQKGTLGITAFFEGTRLYLASVSIHGLCSLPSEFSVSTFSTNTLSMVSSAIGTHFLQGNPCSLPAPNNISFEALKHSWKCIHGCEKLILIFLFRLKHLKAGYCGCFRLLCYLVHSTAPRR